MASSAALGAGAINSGVSAYNQSEALKMQGEYQKQIYEQNTRFAEAQSTDAIRRGDKDAVERLRRGNRDVSTIKKNRAQTIGAQRASLAAQGLDIESGSAADIQAETAALGAEDMISADEAAKLDALTIKNNAWREAWGFKVQAFDYSTRGQLALSTSQNQARNTLVTGGLQTLNYGLQSYDTYSKNKSTKGKS